LGLNYLVDSDLKRAKFIITYGKSNILQVENILTALVNMC
jgi:hypothetical protein